MNVDRSGHRPPVAAPVRRSDRLGAAVLRLVRYGMVGVANAAVYYTTYLLVLPVIGYLAAHVTGLAVAMVASYFLHCRFTFGVRPTWRRFLLFPSSQVTNVLATTVGVVALVHLGVNVRLAPLVAAVVAVPVTFVLTTFVLTGRAANGPRSGPRADTTPIDLGAMPTTPMPAVVDGPVRHMPTARAPHYS